MSLSSNKRISSSLPNMELKESSTITSLLAGIPKSTELARLLHTEYSLPNDIEFDETDSITLGRKNQSWAGGRWYVFAGLASAALFFSNDSREYTVIVPSSHISEDELQDAVGFYLRPRPTLTDGFYIATLGSGTDAKKILKKAIGKFKKIYVQEYGYNDPRKRIDALRKERASRKSGSETVLTFDNAIPVLMRKFKPIFLRTLKSAESDYIEVVQTMLKSRSYDTSHIDARLKYLKIIKATINAYESGTIDDEILESRFATVLRSALYSAASYLHPELTGNVSMRHGYGTISVSVESLDGVHHLLREIQESKNNKAIPTILGFFKSFILRGYLK
jgi:hypothetical protein